MTENNQDQKLTREWLEQKLENDRRQDELVAQAQREERERENLRAAWKQQAGVEPTEAELAHVLAEKRRQDVAQAARLNEAEATRQFMRNF